MTDTAKTRSPKDPAWFSGGMNMIDCDTDWAIRVLSGDLSSPEAILASADQYFDSMLDGSKVTDISFAVFQQTSFVESEHMGWLFRKLTDMEEAGTLDLAGRWGYVKKNVPPLYRALRRFGLDWAKIAIEGCRKKGGRPWLYFRMNDLHSVDSEDSVFHDPFFFVAKEKGYLNGNPAYGHPMGTSGSIENLYDFAHPEVREWLLAYIQEIVLRYDVFGYELDFMRNIYCFDYLRAEEGYQGYMTDFIRRVRELLDRAETAHGHAIKLAVRLGQSVEDNFVYGFDVATWVQEGLVDLLIPSCEEVCNSGVDVAAWRSTVGHDVALLIGFDSHVIRWVVQEATPLYAMREDHLKGFAAGYFNRGADGVYFNNYYSPDKVAKHVDRASAEAGLRTLVVTHRDITPIGHTGYKPLPLPLRDEGVSLSLNVGIIRAGERTRVTVGFDTDKVEDVTVRLNSQSFASRTRLPLLPDRVEGHYYDDQWQFRRAAALVSYEFQGFTTQGDVTVTISGASGRIVYLDVSVSP